MSAPGRNRTFRQHTLGNEVKVSMEQSLLRFLTGKRFFLVLFGVFSATFVWLELDVMFWGVHEPSGAFLLPILSVGSRYLFFSRSQSALLGLAI